MDANTSKALDELVFDEINWGNTWKDNVYIVISRSFKRNIHIKLKDIYLKCEKNLKDRYPANNTIKASIRRNLQILRDENKIEFIKRGLYKLL